MSIAENVKTIVDNQHSVVYEAGKAQRDYEWWDYYQKQYHGTQYEKPRGSYLYAFAGYAWTDEVYNPIREINATDHASLIFAYSSITDTKVPVRITGGTTKNRGQAFYSAINLVTVRKFIVDEITPMNAQFTDCAKLQNLTIEGTIGKNANFQWCPLTRASIESVINALSTTTTGLTCTFKKTAVDAAFETSDGANDGSTSLEWTSMVDKENPDAIRPNWSFALA